MTIKEEASITATCPSCGGPAALGDSSLERELLKIENALLREKLDTLHAIAATQEGKPFGSQLGLMGEIYGDDPVDNKTDNSMIIELAEAALDELIRMAIAKDPLWVPSPDSSTETVNEEEYIKTFPRGIGPTPLGLKAEASRDQAIVGMNHLNLVELLMDVDLWSSFFCGIVSTAKTVEVVSTGVPGVYDGALQVMTAEFQVPSPLVPTRENYFARYCKRLVNGTWAVVDVSLDHLRPDPTPRYRRRPSGCLINELPNNNSEVLWVEHVEADGRDIHNMYRVLVSSAMAFGARRWVATLQRQCERLASTLSTSIPLSCSGRNGVLKMAERAMISFFSGVGATTAKTWKTLSCCGTDDITIKIRNNVDDPGSPLGVVLSAATSFWAPIAPKRVFDYLRDENSKSDWDALSIGGVAKKIAIIPNGLDPGNCVSILRVNREDSSQSNMVIMQESCIDLTGSYVVYVPVDMAAFNMILNGADSDYLPLLSSGFAILPDGPPPGHNAGPAGLMDVGSGGGSLITFAYQIVVNLVPTAELTMDSVGITSINNHLKFTKHMIKEALDCEGA